MMAASVKVGVTDMKLFYTRPGQGVVECCTVVDDQFHMKTMSPDQAIRFASDLLDHAIESKRRSPMKVKLATEECH